jgi:hypothetical protein
MGDVQNFTGLYVRDLDTGQLLERHPYTGRAGSGAPIVATRDLIAVQVLGGVDIVGRTTGAIQNLPKGVLDASGLQIASLENGNLTEPVSLNTLNPRPAQ